MAFMWSMTIFHSNKNHILKEEFETRMRREARRISNVAVGCSLAQILYLVLNICWNNI